MQGVLDVTYGISLSGVPGRIGGREHMLAERRRRGFFAFTSSCVRVGILGFTIAANYQVKRILKLG